MLFITFMIVLSDLTIIGIKKLNFVPVVVSLQAVLISIACFFLGMDIPLLSLDFAVKGLIIPLTLYYTLKKINVVVLDPFAVHFSVAIIFTLATFIASWLFSRQLGAGPFVMAAAFTALSGILLIISRSTILSQFIGFILLQNGISAFIPSFLVIRSPAVEILLALDVLGAVFIITLAIKMIYKNCGSIDIKTFTTLRG